MAKKIITEGAPMYMGQFTALMTILLAFFILLNTLTKQQDAGFNAGIGDVKNSFGIKGGLGIFKYSFSGNAALNPIALEKTSDENQDVGYDKNMTTSGGGSGNTDSEFEESPSGKYLRIRINYDFRKGSATIPNDMREYLKKIGMGIELFGYKIWIRCYCKEYGSQSKDANLANMRASSVMIFLNRYCQIPFDRMIATGAGGERYFDPDYQKHLDKQRKLQMRAKSQGLSMKDIKEKITFDFKELKKDQGLYFYVFFKNHSKHDK